MKIPAVFRSRSYIIVLTGSVFGIIGGVVVKDASVTLAILGLWGVLIGGKQVQSNIDASKGQYFDKKEGKIKKI